MKEYLKAPFYVEYFVKLFDAVYCKKKNKKKKRLHIKFKAAKFLPK